MLQSKLMALVIVLCASVALPATVAAANRTSMDLSATYEVRAKLFWGAKRLQVRSDARIRNDSGHGIERIVFNLVPAKIGRLRDLAVSVDGVSNGSATVSGQSIRVPLGRTLPDGQSVDVRIFVPGVAPTRHGRPRLPVHERDPDRERHALDPVGQPAGALPDGPPRGPVRDRGQPEGPGDAQFRRLGALGDQWAPGVQRRARQDLPRRGRA